MRGPRSVATTWGLFAGLAAVFAVVWLSWPGAAQACSCARPKVSVELQRSAAVFEGTVVAGYARRAETDSVLAVHGVFKATKPLPPLVGVRHRTTSSCRFYMPVGTRYLVFADEREGQLEVSMCSLTSPVERAETLFEQLPPPDLRDNSQLEPAQVELDASVVLGSKPVFKGSRAHTLQVEFSAPQDPKTTVPAAVAVVVDLPKSVGQQQLARQTMRALVKDLPDTTLVTFLSTETVKDRWTIRPLSALDAEGRRQADEFIDHVGAGAKGRLPDTIDSGNLSVVQSPFEFSARFVVVIAAAGEYAGGVARSELGQAGERARDDHVTVSTIAVNLKSKAKGLSRLAEVGGGRFHAASNAVAGATLEAQRIGNSRISMAHVEFAPAAGVDVIGGMGTAQRKWERGVTVRMGALTPGQRATTTLYVDIPPGLAADAEVGTVAVRYWDPARAAGQTAAVFPIRRGTSP